ncbi:helix-turn-helix domain-containing protein [Dyadobacter fermentans]|uniref:Transcriptional regulator, XRE family n=1 Tax=Dyadobacter fermentans (strain ATCC 700827 / DSM 18053 / CIP 107007 / KCTC 52180 / NS114) TaxID=471854 RepID=C6W579_DYAFD|nr:helix-turn-helix transcriptional regulator [Dyadobacter fermentans]ACT92439.1 transcriptional regulator, XRE family [Dyadobacter fermentans DSM 18053]
MSIVGERIKKYRELAGWNQHKLAKALKKSGKAVISNWETGRNDPSLAELRLMAELFGTTVAQLVGEVPMFEEPREHYIMIKKDDLIDLQRKALALEADRINALKEQLEQAQKADESSEEADDTAES